MTNVWDSDVRNPRPAARAPETRDQIAHMGRGQETWRGRIPDRRPPGSQAQALRENRIDGGQVGTAGHGDRVEAVDTLPEVDLDDVDGASVCGFQDGGDAVDGGDAEGALGHAAGAGQIEPVGP